MTGAILQGTPATTLDIDLWIDLPSRQYIRMINLARSLGAEMIANTVVVFPGNLTVNFIYEVSGLKSFSTELRNSRRLQWMGRKVPVLPLNRIYVNKKAAGRPKDLAHLPLLEQTMQVQKRMARSRG